QSRADPPCRGDRGPDRPRGPARAAAARCGRRAASDCEVMRAVIAAYANVVFATHPLAGALVAAATFLVPAAGTGGLLAVIAATAAAIALGYRKDAIASGHYGYNALLVGLAAALHHPLDLRVGVLVALAGIAAALLTAVLGDVLHRGAALPV